MKGMFPIVGLFLTTNTFSLSTGLCRSLTSTNAFHLKAPRQPCKYGISLFKKESDLQGKVMEINLIKKPLLKECEKFEMTLHINPNYKFIGSLNWRLGLKNIKNI